MLIQEIVLKIDLRGLNAFIQTLVSYTTEEDELETHVANFNKDLELSQFELLKEAELESYQNVQHLFHFVHLSPVKVSI